MMKDLYADISVREQSLSRDDILELASRLSPVSLVDCDLENVNLASVDLAGWKFERCNLRRTDFSGTNLERTEWRSCRGAFAMFVNADLTEALFQSSDLNNAVLRRSTLSSASFRSCKLTGADLSDTRSIGAIFEETLLINAKCPAYSFRRQTLCKIDFSQADLHNSGFRAAVLIDCSLRDANMAGSRFEGADLRGADLGGLRLIDAALFRGATIFKEQAGQLLSELGLNVL